MRIWWVGDLHPNTSPREAGAVIRFVIEQHTGVSRLLGSKRRIGAVIPLPTHPQSMIRYRVPPQPPFRIEAVRLGSRRHNYDLHPRSAQPSQRPDHITARSHVPDPSRIKGALG